MDEVQFFLTFVGSVMLILAVLRWASGRYLFSLRGLTLKLFVANVLFVFCLAWAIVLSLVDVFGPPFSTPEGHPRDILGIGVKDWVLFISSFVPPAIVDLLIFWRARSVLRRQSSRFVGSKLGGAVYVVVALILILLNLAVPAALTVAFYTMSYAIENY